MTLAYFDCFCGAAGDMLLAALIDAGCPESVVAGVIAQLGLDGVSLHVEQVERHGLAARRVEVRLADGQPGHRHLPEIKRMIEQASLPPTVRERAVATFDRLAIAEAQVHGIAPEQVHFHEVGAADAIVDIVGVCAALEHLGVQTVECSPVPTGSGTVTCEHGVMPVPAPATAQLLRGVPLAACDEPGELTTPTGAALLTTLASRFGPPPAMTLSAVGVGAGARSGKTRPNIMRVLLGVPHEGAAADVDTTVILETHVDDTTGQALSHAAQLLLEAGALDVYLVPIMMKKGRPGQLLTVLCRPRDADALETIIFAETATLGVRRWMAARSKLARETVTVQTRHGAVRVKVGRRGNRIVRVWPEYEDCAALARQAGVPLRVIQQEALGHWQQLIE